MRPGRECDDDTEHHQPEYSYLRSGCRQQYLGEQPSSTPTKRRHRTDTCPRWNKRTGSARFCDRPNKHNRIPPSNFRQRSSIIHPRCRSRIPPPQRRSHKRLRCGLTDRNLANLPVPPGTLGKCDSIHWHSHMALLLQCLLQQYPGLSAARCIPCLGDTAAIRNVSASQHHDPAVRSYHVHAEHVGEVREESVHGTRVECGWYGG